jgi:hypothetical protein
MMKAVPGVDVWEGLPALDGAVGKKRSRGAAVLGALARRWPYLVVVGMAFTVSAAYVARDVPVAYWARTQVRFMEPLGPDAPNGLRSNTSSLIATASLIQAALTDSHTSLIVSPDSALVDSGVRHGYSVTLPNSGGQWAYYYRDPWLDLQVVGSTPEEVLDGMVRLQQRVVDELDLLQREAGVSAANKIRTEAIPNGTPQVRQESGARTRSSAGVLLLGTLLTCLVVGALRRYARPDPRLHGRATHDAPVLAGVAS